MCRFASYSDRVYGLYINSFEFILSLTNQATPQQLIEREAKFAYATIYEIKSHKSAITAMQRVTYSLL